MWAAIDDRLLSRFRDVGEGPRRQPSRPTCGPAASRRPRRPSSCCRPTARPDPRPPTRRSVACDTRATCRPERSRRTVRPYRREHRLHHVGGPEGGHRDGRVGTSAPQRRRNRDVAGVVPVDVMPRRLLATAGAPATTAPAGCPHHAPSTAASGSVLHRGPAVKPSGGGCPGGLPRLRQAPAAHAVLPAHGRRARRQPRRAAPRRRRLADRRRLGAVRALGARRS